MNKTDLHTSTSKRDGWQARSELKLRENPDGSWLRLEFVTRKHSYGGLITLATVDRVHPDQSSTFFAFQDYNKQLFYTQERCTEKNVIAQHQSVIDLHFDEVLAAVKKQYGL